MTTAVSPLNVEALVGNSNVFVVLLMLEERLWMIRFREFVAAFVEFVIGAENATVVAIGACCQKLVGLTTSPLVETETRPVPALLFVRADHPSPRLVRVVAALEVLLNPSGLYAVIAVSPSPRETIIFVNAGAVVE